MESTWYHGKQSARSSDCCDQAEPAVQIVRVCSLIVPILCVLKTELADVHLLKDTCALSPGTQGPAALLNGAWGVGVGSMDRIGLREGWNHAPGSNYAS